MVGEDRADEDQHAIARVGCQLTVPGLRSLGRLDTAVADDVRRRLAEVLADGAGGLYG